MMKTLFHSIVFPALFLAAVSLPAAKAFEGMIQYEITSGEKTQQMDIYVKDEFLRMEPKGDIQKRQGVILMNSKLGTSTVLLSAQKKYMLTALPKESASNKKSEGTIKKSGRTKTILGYKAEEWIYTSKKNQMEMWGTAELGSFQGYWGCSQGQAPTIPAALRDNPLLPLEVLSKGKPVMRALKVSPKSYPASFFEVPKDFEKLGMPTMGGMGDGAGAGGLPPELMEKMKNLPPEQRAIMEKMFQ